jgi:hypothetical protein
MRVANALFCEYAATTREGKLDAGGILNLVWGPPPFPLRVRPLTLVVTLELEPHEYGSHDFSLRLEDGQGENTAKLLSQRFTATGHFHRLGIDLGGHAFPAPGAYRFHALVDGRDLGDATLIVSDREPVYPAGAESPIA